jgi:hypothetical protein
MHAVGDRDTGAESHPARQFWTPIGSLHSLVYKIGLSTDHTLSDLLVHESIDEHPIQPAKLGDDRGICQERIVVRLGDLDESHLRIRVVCEERLDRRHGGVPASRAARPPHRRSVDRRTVDNAVECEVGRHVGGQ